MGKRHWTIDAENDLAHIAWGLCATLPVAAFAPAWATALAALLFALPRELWDQRRTDLPFRIRVGWSRARDLGGFALGGLVAGFLL